jgi:hypothetical protein
VPFEHHLYVRNPKKLTMLKPPITKPSLLNATLAVNACAVVDAAGLAQLCSVDASALASLAPSWHDLPPDEHLKDGGRYRKRRHSCFTVDAQPAGRQLVQVAHRAHWQPVEYNALHGGIQRWFAPMADAVTQSSAWAQLLLGLAASADAIRPGVGRWFVEAHQFRIDTEGGIGRPTPEGAHRDGVDLVAVILIERQDIKGGETRVFDAATPTGQRFTLLAPWTALLLDDARMIHETTPIQPDGADPYRHTLVLTYRAENFQGPGA